MNALVAMPGGWELILIVLVILLLFGAKKLPELARGSGRALRIFKAETKGLVDDDKTDDDDDLKTPEQKQIEASNAPSTTGQPTSQSAGQPTSQPASTEQPVAGEPIVREQRDGTTS